MLLLSVLAPRTQASTVAYWDLEDGVAGQPFNPASEPAGSTGSLDMVNGEYDEVRIHS